MVSKSAPYQGRVGNAVAPSAILNRPVGIDVISLVSTNIVKVGNTAVLDAQWPPDYRLYDHRKTLSI